MQVREVRDFSKIGDAMPIPNLIHVQLAAYQRFLQKDTDPNKRKNEGIETLLREVFPIESYDGNLKLEYVSYDLSEPRYTTDECRALRLTYGMPFRIQVKLNRKDKDENVKLKELQATYYAVAPIVDAESGEELVKPGAQLGENLEKIQASGLKNVAVVTKVSDPLILNTLAEDTAESHEAALMKIYARLRPGNPPALDKAQTLFQEKFFDENRYRLGRVGRFRINRKFDQEVS